MNSLCLILILFVSTTSYGASSATQKAETCVACHGPNGISLNDLWPNLAGQKRTYLLKQLQQFRSGERQNPLMSPLAKTLSDRDMEDLAEYFSKLEVPK